MAWRTVTENDLKQKFSGDELEAVRSAGLADGQADPIPGHLKNVTDFVRGYIKAWPPNKLGAEGTLPERLILPAIDYLVVEVCSRVAGLLIDLNDTRRQARKDALALFDRVATGRYAIESPTVEVDEGEPGSAAELAGAQTNLVSRETLAGL